MKSVIFILFFSFCGLWNINAQPIENACEVNNRDSVEFENLPWFGNNAYLYNFLDSIGYDTNNNNNFSRLITQYQANFKIPINFGYIEVPQLLADLH